MSQEYLPLQVPNSSSEGTIEHKNNHVSVSESLPLIPPRNIGERLITEGSGDVSRIEDDNESKDLFVGATSNQVAPTQRTTSQLGMRPRSALENNNSNMQLLQNPINQRPKFIFSNNGSGSFNDQDTGLEYQWLDFKGKSLKPKDAPKHDEQYMEQVHSAKNDKDKLMKLEAEEEQRKEQALEILAKDLEPIFNTHFKIDSCNDFWINTNYSKMIILNQKEDKLNFQEFIFEGDQPKEGRIKTFDWKLLKVVEKLFEILNEGDQPIQRSDISDYCITHFKLSSDEKMMVFQSPYKIGVIMFDSLDQFFSDSYDIVEEIKKSFCFLEETKKQTHTFSQVYMSSKNKEVCIKWNGPYCWYLYYQVKLPGKQFYDLLVKQNKEKPEKLLSIEDESVFERKLIDKNDKEKSHTLNVFGEELFSFFNNETLIFYSPEKRCEIPFYIESKNEIEKIVCSQNYGNHYYDIQNEIAYVKIEDTIARYYRQNIEIDKVLQDVLVKKEDNEIKIDIKLIGESSYIVKIYEGIFYFQCDRVIKLWNSKTKMIDQELRVLSHLNIQMQLQNSQILVANNGFHQIFNQEPFKVSTQQSVYLSSIQDGVGLCIDSIVSYEKTFNRDFKLDPKLENDWYLLNYIPSNRIGSWCNQKLKELIVYDFIKGTEITIKEFPGYFKFSNYLKKTDDNSTKNELDKKSVSVNFTYDDEQKAFKAVIIPLNNIKNTVIKTLRTFTNVEGIGFKYCQANNEIALNIQKPNDEKEFYICKVRPHNTEYIEIRDSDFVKLETTISINILLLSKKRLYYTDTSNGSFNVVELNKNYQFSSKRVIFPKIKDVQQCFTTNNSNRIIIKNNWESFYITNSRGTMIKSRFDHVLVGEFINDWSHPDRIMVRDFSSYQLARLRLFDQHPLCLPTKFFIKEDMFTVYNGQNKTLSYFKSIDKDDDSNAVAKIRIRSYLNSYLDLQKNSEGEQVNNSQDVIEYINSTPIDDLLSYNILERKSFLYEAIKLDKGDNIVEALIKKINGLPPGDIPFLFPKSGIFGTGKTAFDLALDKHLSQFVRQLLNIMVECDPRGTIYQPIIDKNIEKLLERGVDIKNYLKSAMPLHQIEEQADKYPHLHEDDAVLRLPADFENLPECEEKMYSFITQALEQRKTFHWWKTIRNYFSNATQNVAKPEDIGDSNELSKIEPIILEVAQKSNEIVKIESDGPKESEAQILKRLEEGKSMKTEIEYYIINLKKILTKKKQLFMKIILDESDFDITVLEIPLIQEVIEFKWATYTRNFFIWQFIKILIFLASFIADIVVMSPDGYDRDTSNFKVACIVTRSICGIYMIDFVLYELRQFHAEGFDSYFNMDIWNFFDMSFFAIYVSYIPISFIYSDSDDYVVKILQCLIILLLLIKFNFYLRIFEGFSFLVQMIQAVFYDLRFFLLYYCIIISAFSIQVSIIMDQVDGHDGIGPVQFFVMTLRTSLGDNDIAEEYSEYKILFWIIWLLIMFVGNIVLMNFIIAVVGESYENCMTTRDAQCYKVKVMMIVERELIMMQWELDNKEWFPNYILVRRPQGDNSQAENDVNSKMIKEITILKNDFASKFKAQEEALTLLQTSVNDAKNEAIAKNKEFSESFKSIHDFLKKAHPEVDKIEDKKPDQINQ